MSSNTDILLKVDEKPKGGQWFGLSFQHLFAMFGSTVLVPILVGIDPAIALLSSGLGTLAHMSVTRFKVPAYMGSSFAYIGAMQLLMKQGGMPAIAQGALTGGLVYLLVAVIVRFAGQGWIDRVLPPIVVGPIVMVIGLSLAPVAINDSMYTNPGAMTGYSLPFLAISMITVMAIVIFSIYGKGFLSVVVSQASWLSLPTMEIPFLSYKWAFYPSAILTMAPIAFVTMTEHFGHIMVLNSLTGKDYFKEPGLDRTLAGDGVAQVIASFIGAPPVTSYGENIGVMAITKIHSIYVIAGAAVLAVVVSFIGKLTALLTSIPSPVIGGASIALFGVIAASGLKIIVENKINFDIKRNLLISSVVLVIGIGGMVLDITQNLQISSVAIATIIGIVLNLVLPEEA